MKRCPTCQTAFPTNYTHCPRDGSVLTDVGEWAAGTLVRGKYQILGKVGQGGMGAVYKAMHVRFKEVRALKVMSPELAGDATFVRRFEQEAVITRKLVHPNAVRVEDIDEAEDGRPFMVMEYIEGRSLRDVIEREAPMAVPRVCSIVTQVAAALDAAHALGLVHRDIKPANISLVKTTDASGNPFEQVKVLDFGIAKLRETQMEEGKTHQLTLTGTGVVIGTPSYMSPEQARGLRGDQLDGRSDLYSLGIVMYQMLTGQLPIKADSTIEQLMAHINTLPKPIREERPELNIPEDVATLVMRCLEKNRDLRPATGQALIKEFTATATGNTNAASSPMQAEVWAAPTPGPTGVPTTVAGPVPTITPPTQPTYTAAAPPASASISPAISPSAEVVPTTASIMTPAPSSVVATPASIASTTASTTTPTQPATTPTATAMPAAEASTTAVPFPATESVPALSTQTVPAPPVAPSTVTPSKVTPSARTGGWQSRPLVWVAVIVFLLIVWAAALYLRRERTLTVHEEQPVTPTAPSENPVVTPPPAAEATPASNGPAADGSPQPPKQTEPAPSPPVSIVPTPAPTVQPVHATTGFNAEGWELNGDAKLDSSRLRLTEAGREYQASSAFLRTRVGVHEFTVDFNFKLTNAEADGFAFVIQNAGADAIGPEGGGLGYAPPPDQLEKVGFIGIGKSVAVKFQFTGHVACAAYVPRSSCPYYESETGLLLNGLFLDKSASQGLSPAIDLTSGDEFRVHMAYDGRTLAMSITDEARPSQHFATRWRVDIPNIVESKSAYIGFTGGTGSRTATQEIIHWSYSPKPTGR